MEQPCYKCGQMVEEGVAFCPHCAAPQIRVVVAEPAFASGPAAATTTASATNFAPTMVGPLTWSASATPCALAALIAAVLMVLKLMVPLIAIMGAGFLAVAFYQRRNPESLIRARTGARLGAICGFFCFDITVVLESIKILAFREIGEVRQTLLDAVQQTATRYHDPQLQPTIEFLRSPSGLVFMSVFLLIFVLIFFLALGVAGGAIGGAFLGRGRR